MRIPLLVYILFLAINLHAQILPIEPIAQTGANDKRINFVFVGDGYKADEIPNYLKDVEVISNSLFKETPFSNYASFFNLYAIEVASNESGADHPATAGNETPSTAVFPYADVDNYFNSTFDYYGIHRLLVPRDNYALAMVLANNFPSFDQGFILVNSTEYGGSGGPYATASVHPSSAQIAIHEIGHSFASLADEYWLSTSYAKEDHNMTANPDPETVKWKDWVGEEGVGLYPHGYSGTAATWYRPHQSCKMRSLNYPFCAVCRERFIDKIYSLVSPIENFYPSSTDVDFKGDPLTFSMDLVLPSPNTLIVDWVLNEKQLDSHGGDISLAPSDFIVGNNTLKAIVTDTTLLSKSYKPASGYVFSVEWNILNDPVLPIEFGQFEARPQDHSVLLDWTTATELNNEKFVIERSNNGINFEKIGQKMGVGESQHTNQYSFVDKRPFQGNNYYRIKQVNFDGTAKYSQIRSANFVRKFFYKIYPNPASNTIYFNYYNSDESPMKIELTDISGKTIKQIDEEIPLGSSELKIDISDLPSGIFFLHLFNDGYQESFKIVKK